MTSFTHYDINGVITFYILIFNMISTIFNLIFKTLYGSLILGAGMHNTTHSPFTLFYFEIFNCSIYQGEHSDLLLSVHTCTCERNHFNKDFFFFFKCSNKTKTILQTVFLSLDIESKTKLTFDM